MAHGRFGAVRLAAARPIFFGPKSFPSSLGPTLIVRGSFSVMRLAAARPPSACQPSPTGDVEIQDESCQRQIGSQVQM